MTFGRKITGGRKTEWSQHTGLLYSVFCNK